MDKGLVLAYVNALNEREAAVVAESDQQGWDTGMFAGANAGSWEERAAGEELRVLRDQLVGAYVVACGMGLADELPRPSHHVARMVAEAIADARTAQRG